MLMPESYLASTVDLPGMVAEPALSSWPVKIFTLGCFLVELQKKPPVPEGAGGKPMELLKLLISLGRNGLAEERILDALWPDAEPGSGEKTFHITLHRLRNIVGGAVLQLKDKKLRLEHSLCWVDAWYFEDLMDRIDGRSPGDLEEAADFVERAFALYRGEFLASECESPWVFYARERLREKFLRHLIRWSDHLRRIGKYGDAIHCLKRGLEVDPLAEELFQRLMTCQHERGYAGEIEKTYRKCKRLLNSILGVEPSQETITLYHGLSARS